jgi:hypothetical protein
MSLRSVLTHQARLIEPAATGARVEGTPLFAALEGPWFRCRLFPDETPETEGARQGRRVIVKGPHIVCGVVDVDGNPIEPGDITPARQIEVDAGILGRQLWTVKSDPQPLQNRTRLLAFYFTVQRTETAGAAGDDGDDGGF